MTLFNMQNSTNYKHAEALESELTFLKVGYSLDAHNL